MSTEDCGGENCDLASEGKCTLQEVVNYERDIKEMKQKLCQMRLKAAQMIAEFATLHDPLMRRDLALAYQSRDKAAAVVQQVALPSTSGSDSHQVVESNITEQAATADNCAEDSSQINSNAIFVETTPGIEVSDESNRNQNCDEVAGAEKEPDIKNSNTHESSNIDMEHENMNPTSKVSNAEEKQVDI